MGRLSIEVPPGLHWQDQYGGQHQESTGDRPPRIVRWMACWADA